jgi:vancomycin resistance protein YoaR
VSQVTGTLFNTALFAGLDIVTYRTHSRPVKYLPLGRDATVSWGNFDMKFKNNTDAPVAIRYAIEGTQVVCTLYGHVPPARRVTLDVTSERLGPTEITATLMRTISEGGKVLVKQTVGHSHYDWKTDNED